jgi:hypothetical protein
MRVTPVAHANVGAADVELAGYAVRDFVTVVVEEHAFAVGVELAHASRAIQGQYLQSSAIPENLLVDGATRDVNGTASDLRHSPTLYDLAAQFPTDLSLQLLAQRRGTTKDIFHTT